MLAATSSCRSAFCGPAARWLRNTSSFLGDAMPGLDDQSFASLLLEQSWASHGVKHRDQRFVARANMWRDMLPAPLDRSIMGAGEGERRSAHYDAGRLVAKRDEGRVLSVPRTHWDAELIPRRRVEPVVGRYYPAGFIWKSGRGGIYRETRTPLRIVSMEDASLTVDLNHPLAGVSLDVAVTVEAILDQGGPDNGGRVTDWAEVLTEGTGLQARHAGNNADYLARRGLGRIDSNDDALFYREPRLVAHLDATASREIAKIYGELLAPGMRVLDLMSSMQSHLPDVALDGVAGLGMSAAELAANPRLTERVVHDLNRQPGLPFEGESFDAALCTASIEYLTDPVSVVRGVARVLKPGSPIAVTWSNRWFPSKAVDIWADLHPFERVGYVVDALARSGAFDQLKTRSVQGHPRPAGDRYAETEPLSDPVFAVVGRRT